MNAIFNLHCDQNMKLLIFTYYIPFYVFKHNSLFCKRILPAMKVGGKNK